MSMSKYCVAFETMVHFIKCPADQTVASLVRCDHISAMSYNHDQLELISEAKEFQDIRLRVNEKRILNELNMGPERKKEREEAQQRGLTIRSD
jgi:hypothetical protein